MLDKLHPAKKYRGDIVLRRGSSAPPIQYPGVIDRQTTK